MFDIYYRLSSDLYLNKLVSALVMISSDHLHVTVRLLYLETFEIYMKLTNISATAMDTPIKSGGNSVQQVHLGRDILEVMAKTLSLKKG